ncbi:tetratricopeptide repeat protein [Oceanobacter mangrovi]|uniref:tetratricopeptide repeat protein n=1 Tax=Oceanobacter mangrovi TaxID=2862510 RepID=UPI001C8DA95D|nr:hypothetical protein [Oceanobacter mangrovi]
MSTLCIQQTDRRRHWKSRHLKIWRQWLLGCLCASVILPATAAQPQPEQGSWLDQLPAPDTRVQHDFPRLEQQQASQLLELLAQRDFAGLNQAYLQLDKAAVLHPGQDLKAMDAFELWRQAAASYTEEDFDLWIKSAPENHTPRLAKAWYLFGKAVNQRQFSLDEMAQSLAQAMVINQQLLAAKPDSSASLILQLQLHDYLGQREEEATLAQQIIHSFNGSAALADAVLRSASPLQGGSYQQMLELAQALVGSQTKPQDWQWLYGVVLEQAATSELKAKRSDHARHLLELSLQYGSRWQTRYELARLAYFFDRDKAAAAVYVEQALALASAQPEPHLIQSRLEFSRGNYQSALKHLQWARNLMAAGLTDNWQQWAAEKLSDRAEKLKQHETPAALAEALQMVQLAAEFNPNDTSLLMAASSLSEQLGK